MRGLFIGATSIDIIYPLSHFPIEDSKNYTQSEVLDIGGPATNAAFAFSALGGKSTLVSLIGDNPFSNFIQQRLSQYGIDHIDLNDREKSYPAISSILINQSTGSRTLASTIPRMEGQLNLNRPIPRDYDIVCTDGFYGDCSLEILKDHKDLSPIVFDGGSYKPKTEELLDNVSYPIFSENFEFPDQVDLTTHLTNKSITRFAITRGGNPVKVVDQGNEYEIPVPKVNAIDTLGAGDIFHGAFCWYFLQNEEDFQAALTKAVSVASLSCQYSGTREWAANLDEQATS